MSNEVLAALAAKYGPELAKVLLNRALALKGDPGGWVLLGSYTESPVPGRKEILITQTPGDPIRLVRRDTGDMLIAPSPEFLTDFASIPAFCRKLAEKYAPGLHLAPRDFPRIAAFHDDLYATQKVIRVRAGRQSLCAITRAQADAILGTGLLAAGSDAAGAGSASRAETALIVEAVAVGGGRAWKNGPASDPYAQKLFDLPVDVPGTDAGSIPPPAISALSLDALLCAAVDLAPKMKAAAEALKGLTP
jgi:hypothetical protein